MARHLIRALALCLLAACVRCTSVLVLLDSPEQKQTHSQFLGQLRGFGWEVDVQPIGDPDLRLNKWDEWMYDKLVILGGKNALGGTLDVALLLRFADAGHDLVLALDPAAGNEAARLAAELGVDLDEPGSVVIDHGAYDGALGGKDHTVVFAGEAPAANPNVFPRGIQGHLLYSGLGLSASPQSQMAWVELGASPTAFTGQPGAPLIKTRLTGRGVGLVALVQARNNARAAVVGSVEFFSDAFFVATCTSPDGKSLGGSSNAAVSLDLLSWALSRRGVLRVTEHHHRVVGGPLAPERYRVNDEVEFSATIERIDDDVVAPYTADDLQVELVMLDPYVRAPMTAQGNGTFTARFRAPDVYGVFKWVLDYRRRGLSWLHVTKTVPIRPFYHNEYERFIFQAYPYYGSILGLMAAFFVLSISFLYSK